MSLWDALNRRLTARIPVNPVRNKSASALVSFTFDDCPRSAWTVGGPILKQHGVCATYYAVGSFAGQDVDGIAQFEANDLKAIMAEGHEIASHSFSHRPVHELSNQSLIDDESNNTAFFRSHLGDFRPASFAYPFGEVSPRTKALYARTHASNRGIRPGLNGAVFDMAQLKAVPLERRSWSEAMVESWVAKAVAKSAWLIFFTHDVADDPSPYGATPAMLDHALSLVKASGIEVLPVKHAVAKTQFR